VSAVELNEAFAAQSLACVDAWLDQGMRDARTAPHAGRAVFATVSLLR
jgi:acetyl-CoA acyltransferase